MNKKIKPILSFESDIHPHHCKQFTWIHDGEDFATSKAAGKEMMIVKDSDEKTYKLSYLDMKHPENFKTMDAAKKVAPYFAMSVLAYMSDMINDKHNIT